MDEEFSNLFKNAKNTVLSNIHEITPPINIVSNDSQKTYTLTHRYTNSKNTFLGFDANKDKIHLKIFPCLTFQEIQQANNKIKQIYESFSENSLAKLQDKFVLLDEGRWYFVIVTKTINGVNIYEFSDFLHSNGKNICKDLCIAILLVMIDFIQYNRKLRKLDVIYPNSIMICKNSGGLPFSKMKKESFSIIVLPFSNKTLFERNTKIANLYRNTENDLWGLGISIYGLIGSFSYTLLPDLINLTNEQLKNIILLKETDPALETIFTLISKSNIEEVVSHPYLKIWGGICQKNWESIDMCGVEHTEVLHSGLFFNDLTSRTLVIKKILVLGKVHSEIYEYLVSHNLFNVFIEKCIKIDWKECPELLEPFYKFLKYKPKDSKFKGKLVKSGIFGLVQTTLELDPHNRGFLEFVNDFCYENTLTLLQILYDKGVVNRSIKVAKLSHHDKDFLCHTMSFYGLHSLKVMELIFNSELFPVYWIVQGFIEIPYYIKLEKLPALLKLLLMILKKNNNKEDIDVIKSSINLIIEIVDLPSILQSNHLKGQCSSHIDDDIVLSRNKFLISCIECNVPICSSCHKSVHSTHACYYMLHITPHFRCNCIEIHSMTPNNPAKFTTPKYSKKFVFTASNGVNYNESDARVFSSDKDLTISTTEPFESNNSESAVAYFEVKINKAGNYENIVIGLIGAEIYYHGINGKITFKNTMIGKGPRFGSYDTIGIGLMQSSSVFITYNGLLLNQFFKGEETKTVKMFVGMFGQACEVEIKLNNFLFLSIKSNLDYITGEAKKGLEEILKLLVNVLKKNVDPKLIEYKEYFEKMLAKNNRNDLLKKMKSRRIF